MNKFTIKDLENLSGIKAHTIRIWEQRYSFLKPQRTTTNIRYYSNDELKTLLNISLLNKFGFKISHINKMSSDELHKKTLTLTGTEAQQERIVNEMIQSMIELDIELFEKIIDQYIVSKGIEKCIIQIIFPFLERIGILWVTDHINPAQEHIISNIIRQKLIVGIDKIVPVLNHPKKIVLYMPENEHHELGLLFVQYLMKSRGIKTIYLGADVPVKDLEYVVQVKKPDYIYTHLTTVIKEFNFDKFLVNLHNRFPSEKILISGVISQTFNKKPHPLNVKFLNSLAEVNEFIADLV